MNPFRFMIIEAILDRLVNEVNDKISDLFIRRCMERAEADGWLPDLIKEMETEVAKAVEKAPIAFGSDEGKSNAVAEHARNFVKAIIEDLKNT